MPGYARVIRTQTIALKYSEFVTAAQSMGASTARILRVHILPNVIGPVAVYVTLTIPVVILAESFLSFLGLGVNEPLTSLGVLISNGAKEMQDKVLQNDFTLEDFLKQLKSLKKMGSLESLLGMLPMWMNMPSAFSCCSVPLLSLYFRAVTLEPSPNTAAATARQKSASRPSQLSPSRMAAIAGSVDRARSVARLEAHLEAGRLPVEPVGPSDD